MIIPLIDPATIALYKCGGPPYRTRDGRRAVVLESNVILSTGDRIWQGRVEGEWCEWCRNGRHHGGDCRLDLVGPWQEGMVDRMIQEKEARQ